MQWVLNHTVPSTTFNKGKIDAMSNVIHIDEKWFYLNLEMRRFYLLPEEDDPYRCCQSKRYKIKVMFMGVIGRPLYDEIENLLHDGKYGIYPFVYKQRAIRASKNRQAGTMETNTLQNIGTSVIRDMLIQVVIPSIKEKWPTQLSKDVVVQWDNARSHKGSTDSEFRHACTSNGFNIQLVFQPPQSPNLNVLDLELFNTIQSLQYKSFPKNIDELIEKVAQCYETFDPIVNKYTWLTLHHIMVEILKVNGGNNYKIPHIGKREMDSLGILPDFVEVEQQNVDNAVNYLNERLFVADGDTTMGTEDNQVDVD